MINLQNKDTLRKYNELTDRVLNLIDEQAEDKMSRGDLQGCVEAIIMTAMDYHEPPNVREKEKSKADRLEKEVRAKWAADGVSQEKQDAILADVTAKAQPGAQIGPFRIGY